MWHLHPGLDNQHKLLFTGAIFIIIHTIFITTCVSKTAGGIEMATVAASVLPDILVGI